MVGSVKNEVLLNALSSVPGSPFSPLGPSLPSLPGKPLTAGALHWITGQEYLFSSGLSVLTELITNISEIQSTRALNGWRRVIGMAKALQKIKQIHITNFSMNIILKGCLGKSCLQCPGNIFCFQSKEQEEGVAPEPFHLDSGCIFMYKKQRRNSQACKNMKISRCNENT